MDLNYSDAHRWTNCAYSATWPKAPYRRSQSADEGKVASMVASLIFYKPDAPEVPDYGTRFVVNYGQVLTATEDEDEGSIVVFDRKMHELILKFTNEVQRDPLYEHSINHVVPKLIEGGEDTQIDAVTHGEEGEITLHQLHFGHVEHKRFHKLIIAAYAYLDCFTVINLKIHQPRLNVVHETTFTIDEIKKAWEQISSAAKAIASGERGFKAGSWCANCNAGTACKYRDKQINDITEGKLTEIAKTELNELTLADKYKMLDQVKAWCKSVEQEVYREMVENGEKLSGLKVVEGQGGKRKWISEEEVEAKMTAMKLKHGVMYSKKVISPTAAEAAAKAGDIGPRQWAKLQDEITRSEGKLTIALEDDKRPAVEVKPPVDLMPDLPNPDGFSEDLV